jgi:hypothetical protein
MIRSAPFQAARFQAARFLAARFLAARFLAARLQAALTLVASLASCGPDQPARAASDGAAPTAPESATGSATSAELTSSAAAPTEPAQGAAAAPVATASGEINLDGEDNLDADIAELSKATKAPADHKGTDLSGRDIVYRVTPQGLVIELDGIHLRPEAKAFRDSGGTYGVQLTLTAESFDERQYWVSKPPDGPLALAGKIEAPTGKKQRFGDERHGANEAEVVRAGEPRKFKQRWPGKGQPKLHAGQTLTLEVGLWGMHAESERERPVKRLFELKLVGANPPTAVITPPTLDWGN